MNVWLNVDIWSVTSHGSLHWHWRHPSGPLEWPYSHSRSHWNIPHSSVTETRAFRFNLAYKPICTGYWYELIYTRACQYDIIEILKQYVGRGGALVELAPFVQRVVGLNPALAAMQGPWASPTLPVALQHETPTQYPCCVWSASE